ncbi:helix-turn-helix domain-containing protein [Desulfofundulus sp.]|uniref:helix-turn-helix domain-containing protein n=1 Tax=Desulfofundulus sp. TaxID=2282750 RepID=UPI003C70905F
MSSFKFPEIDMSLPPGLRLEQLRKEAGLSVKQLAKQAGVSPDTIRSAEKGICSLRVPTAAKLARVFKVSPGLLTIPKTTDGARGELAGKITALRLMLGLKQSEFAALLGVNPSSVRDWELGKRKMSKHHEMLLEICTSLLPHA